VPQQKKDQAAIPPQPPEKAYLFCRVGHGVVMSPVRDRKGNLVEDLKKEDFKVYEDNMPKASFTFSAEKVAMDPGLRLRRHRSGRPYHCCAARSWRPLPLLRRPLLLPIPLLRRPLLKLSIWGLNPGLPVKKELLEGKRLMILFSI